MNILQTIKHFKRPELTGFIPVIIQQNRIGWTPQQFAKQLSQFNQTWLLQDDTLVLSDQYQDFDSRTQAIDRTFTAMSAAGLLPVMPDYSAFGGIDWFPVAPVLEAQPFCLVKRFYSAYLGVKVQSALLNGYTGDRYWAAQRSQFVDESKGKLDIITAGAVIHGQSILDCLAEEAKMEAGLTKNDLSQAKKATSIQLYYLNKNGFLIDEIYHIFDLHLSDDFIPQTRLPHEVEGFKLVPIGQQFSLLKNNNFKPEVDIVLVDFLLRHHYIKAESKEFPELSALINEDRKIEEFIP